MEEYNCAPGGTLLYKNGLYIRKGSSVHVKRQYSQAKAAFKGIHRMTSLAFDPIDLAPKEKSSVDKSPSCD